MALHTFGGTPADVLTDTAGNAIPDYPLRVRAAGTGAEITALYEVDGTTPIGQLRSSPTGRIRAFKADAVAIEYEYLDAGGNPVRWYQAGRELATDAHAAAQAAAAGLADKLDKAGGTVSGSLHVEGALTAPGLPDMPGARLFFVEGAVGNGVVDDRAAIQAALDAAYAAGGGTVVIPGGRTYGVSTFLVVRSNTTIWAYGATIRAIGNTGILRNFLSSETFAAYSGHSNIVILGGVWDGNAADGATGSVTGMTNVMGFVHAKNITIRDATIRNVSSAHALEFNSTDGGQVVNCRFEGFKDNSVEQNRGFAEAVQIDLARSGSASIGQFDNTPSRNILVQGCYFGPSDRLGRFGRAVGSHTLVAGTYYDNIRVIGCRIDGALQEGIYGYGWRRAVISSNVITSTGMAGIRCGVPVPATAGYTLTPHSITISGNTVEASAADGSIQVSGEAGGATYTGVAITGNVVRASGNVGLRVDYCTGPTITGNVSETSSSTGIFAQLCTDPTITGNVVRSAGSNAINVSGCPGSNVTGNTVNTTSSNYGIFVGQSGTTDSQYAHVTGNYVVAAAAAGIRLSAGAVGSTVTGNKIRRGSGATVNGITLSSTATGAVIAGNDLSGNGWTAAVAIVASTAAPVLDWAGGTASPGHNRI